MQTRFRLIKYGFLVTSAILVIIGNLLLPENPERNLYPTLLILGFALLAGSLIANMPGTWKGVLNMVLTIVVVLAAILASRPIGKTIDEALSINAQNQAAVMDGLAAAEEIKKDPTANRAQIEKRLSDTYLPVQYDIAQEAINVSLDGTADQVLVQDIVDPQVKLIEGKWNCRAEGCAFRGISYIFTIRTDQQWSGLFLMLSGFAFYAATLRVQKKGKNYE